LLDTEIRDYNDLMEMFRGWPESLRQYNEEFKRDAVALTYKSDKKIPAIADDLSINRTVLARWCREFEKLGSNAFLRQRFA